VKYLILLPAVIHLYIFIVESFLWDKPRTMRTFHTTSETAAATKPLAFNQGFYNLFLALAVLIGFVLWMGFPPGGASAGFGVMIFGLGAIFAAGLVLIVSTPTMWPAALLQIVPAVLGLGLALGSFA